MSEITPVVYAIPHQIISAIHSMVCIPTRYWKDVLPINGEVFQLIGAGDSIITQPSTWQVSSKPGMIKNVDAECVQFFRQLWRFKDGWIAVGDDLLCFKADLLQHDKPSRTAMLAWLDHEMTKKGW